jgi:hypothetical protein
MDEKIPTLALDSVKMQLEEIPPGVREPIEISFSAKRFITSLADAFLGQSDGSRNRLEEPKELTAVRRYSGATNWELYKSGRPRPADTATLSAVCWTPGIRDQLQIFSSCKTSWRPAIVISEAQRSFQTDARKGLPMQLHSLVVSEPAGILTGFWRRYGKLLRL